MPLTASRKSKLAITGLAAAAGLALAAPASQAATLSLNYSCTYPLIGAQPLKVTIDAAVPTTGKVGTPTAPFAVKATAVAGGNTYSGITLTGAKSIEGKATAGASLTVGATKQAVTVPITVAKYAVPATAGDLTLAASGTAPAITPKTAGAGKVTVDSLKLNLVARKADGTPVQLPPVGADSDGDPNTFDVACTLSPATQSTQLATVTVS